MTPQAILDFWFARRGHAEHGIMREMWFTPSVEVDAECKQRFSAVHRAARSGELDDWQRNPRATLALVIVLDQFSRNMYRDTPAAFDSDTQARTIAQQALAKGYDAPLTPLERLFIYLPFEHSENLADQQRSIVLFDSLSKFPQTATLASYARAHYEVIVRFGRFPHRNSILGRPSTAEEARFLAAGGARW